eukprot:Em0014g301a
MRKIHTVGEKTIEHCSTSNTNSAVPATSPPGPVLASLHYLFSSQGSQAQLPVKHNTLLVFSYPDLIPNGCRKWFWWFCGVLNVIKALERCMATTGGKAGRSIRLARCSGASNAPLTTHQVTPVYQVRTLVIVQQSKYLGLGESGYETRRYAAASSCRVRPPASNSERLLSQGNQKDVYITALSEMDKLEESIQGLFQRTLTFGMEVADHLERAILSVDKDKLSKERVKSLSSFYDNLKHIDEEMEKVFAKNGLKRTHPLGELFDPEYHEVDFEVEGDKADMPGKIAVVVSSGYVFNGKPIRPAKVGVFKPKSK